MKLFYLNVFVLIVLFISSCNTSPVDVVVDRSADDSIHTKIVIDGKDTLHFTGDSTTAIKLKPGNHYVQVNDSTKQDFTVTKNGGILNLSNEEYVIYSIKYTATEKNPYGLDLNTIGMKAAILIDSFVIMPKTSIPPTDGMLRKIAARLTSTQPDTLKNEVGYSKALSKIGKGQLFINKTWDYNMTDSIPESVMIKSSSYSLTNSTTRSSILRSQIFLFAVLLTEQDEYIVKSLREIREGKSDEVEEKKVKEEEKDVKKKQMQF